jgi:hypothetical protein
MSRHDKSVPVKLAFVIWMRAREGDAAVVLPWGLSRHLIAARNSVLIEASVSNAPVN